MMIGDCENDAGGCGLVSQARTRLVVPVVIWVVVPIVIVQAVIILIVVVIGFAIVLIVVVWVVIRVVVRGVVVLVSVPVVIVVPEVPNRHAVVLLCFISRQKSGGRVDARRTGG